MWFSSVRAAEPIAAMVSSVAGSGSSRMRFWRTLSACMRTLNDGSVLSAAVSFSV